MMSRPLRLVPQAAQPIEFCCPLCGSVHAAYIFGTDQFRIFRCGGCALTFSKNAARSGDPSSPVRLNAPQKSRRSERDHAGLLAAINAVAIEGPVLVVADAQDDLIKLLEGRGLQIGAVVAAEDFGSAGWGKTYHGAIVTDALMRVSDPRLALMKIRMHLAPGAPLLLSVPLLDARQARLMGRAWHEWQAGNRWYFTRETLNLLLLSASFERVWFSLERRSYSLDTLSSRMQGNNEAA